MKIKLAWTLLCFAFLFACNSGNAVKEKESYNATKKSLLKKEEKNPSAFITVTGNSKKNIVGQTVVKGTLINQIINPGESQNFKTKYFAPKGTDSVGLQVLGAKVIQP